MPSVAHYGSVGCSNVWTTRTVHRQLFLWSQEQFVESIQSRQSAPGQQPPMKETELAAWLVCESSWTARCAEHVFASRTAKCRPIRGLPSGDLRMMDGQGREILRDGRTPGEVVMHGNAVVAGHYGGAKGTARAICGAWFHRGRVSTPPPTANGTERGIYAASSFASPQAIRCGLKAAPRGTGSRCDGLHRRMIPHRLISVCLVWSRRNLRRRTTTPEPGR
jgi:hypothetical protein